MNVSSGIGLGAEIEPEIHFSAVNYAVFGSMLMLSALIGVYFGFISKKKQDTTEEYLLGGRKMNFFPIAASLIASHISGLMTPLR